MKNVIDIAYAGLDRQFLRLEKEMKSYNSLLDVDKRTLSRLVGKDKAGKLHKELVDTIGHPYIGAESGFIVINSPSKLGKAKRIIAKYSEEASASDLFGTREDARGKLILQKSRQAGARHKKNVQGYFKSISRYTSPELLSELSAKNTSNLDTIKLTFKVPTGREYKKLEKQAIAALVTGVNYGEAEDIRNILDSKLNMIGDVFEKGKAATKSIRKKRRITKKKSKPTIYDTFQFDDEQDYAEEEMYPTSLFGTLSTLINSYLREDNRKSATGAPVMHNKTEEQNQSYLRNQSLRFATSAQIDFATRDPNDDSIVDIGYSYMYDPYSKFVAHGWGRNPENIIEGAIRDIMVERFTRSRIRSIGPT